MKKNPLYQLARDWSSSGIPGLILEKSYRGFTYFIYSYKKLGKTFLITPPLSPYALEVESEEGSLDSFIGFLQEKHSKAYIHLILNLKPENKEVLRTNGFSVSQKPNFLLNLSRSPEELKQGLSSTRRRNINKAERELQIRFDSDRKKAFDLFRDTYKKGSLSIPEVFFNQLESKNTSHQQILACVYKGSELLAANLCVVSGDVAYYLLGGVDQEMKNPQAGSFSLWNCILKARNMGAKTINFCGSSVPGIARFFKSFGGRQVEYLEVKKGHKAVDLVKRLKTGLNN